MDAQSVIVQCSKCSAKNRIPKERWGSTAACGKCKAPLDLSRSFPDRPVQVSDNTFSEEILRHPGPILLEFTAAW
jgi:thioredoxin 2